LINGVFFLKLFCGRDDVDESSRLQFARVKLDLAGAELYDAFYSRVEGVIGTATNMLAGAKLGASLANQNHSGINVLAVKTLDAKPFCDGIATKGG
jgi:hypothetical protein